MMILFKEEKKNRRKIHENIMKINLYSRTPFCFTIQFQTLIFVISANRVNVRVVRKILEVWCTCNILIKPCIIFEFLTLLSYFGFYLCPNAWFTYVRTPLSYLSFLRLCVLPRLLSFLYVFAFYMNVRTFDLPMLEPF